MHPLYHSEESQPFGNDGTRPTEKEDPQAQSEDALRGDHS